MQGILYEEGSIGVFLLVSVFLGGGAAWLSGRAVSRAWLTRTRLFVYVLILTFGVRFLHFALFEGHLLTAYYYIVDLGVLLITGLLGFQYERAAQMTRQYSWMYERTGPFTWRSKPGA
jgi:hypothetical protein